MATTETVPIPPASADRPLISVVIATHNYAHYLPQAVNSVLGQTYTNWECLIVDDASSDDTPQVAAELVRGDARIRYIRNERNRGEAGSRNVGNAAASGEWIAVLDADDWWAPRKLESQVRSLCRRPGAVLGFAGATVVSGERESAFFCDAEWLADLPRTLRTGDAIVHSSVVVSRAAVRMLGGYDESLPYAVDWDLWLRLMRHHGPAAFVYQDEAFVFYRLHTGNMSRNWHRNNHAERRVVARSLLTDGWGLRHPAAAWQVVDRQIEREMRRYETGGLKARAAMCALQRIALFPVRPWRWSKAVQILKAPPMAAGEAA